MAGVERVWGRGRAAATAAVVRAAMGWVAVREAVERVAVSEVIVRAAAKVMEATVVVTVVKAKAEERAAVACARPVTDELLLHQTIHNSRAECVLDATLADRDVGSARPWSTYSTGATGHPRYSHESMGAHAAPSRTIGTGR